MRVPFFQKKPSEIQKSFVMVTLTQMGQKEAENFDASSGKEFEVLAALNQKRPQSLGSLAKEAQISFNDCLKTCKELKMKGLVEQVQRQQ
jgi:DNA-binding MarR family transcriptional regulator